MPPAVAEIVAVVALVTLLVVIGKVAVVAPAATITLAGTVAERLLLERVAVIPPVGAGPLSVTVPVDPVPLVTLVGETETPESAGGETVKVAYFLVPPVCGLIQLANIVTVRVEAVAVVVTGKVAVLAPVTTTTLLGTVTLGSLECKAMLTADPWTVLVVTVPVATAPPTLVPGLTEQERRLGELGADTAKKAD